MYLREVHAEPDIPSLREFLQSNTLGILTTAISSQSYPFLQCTHVPWVIDVEDDRSATELPRLRGHLARNNPHAKALIEAAHGKGSFELEGEVMVLFNGPVHHYVSPKFYVETKPTTGKVVPTWNYSAAQCYGKATVYLDANSESTTSQFLDQQLSDLTRLSETRIMGDASPWKVSDAPEKYVGLLKKGIIGIAIEVTRLEGKWKMSQESSEGDREGVIQGFEALGTEVGMTMAATVRERADLRAERKSKASASI